MKFPFHYQRALTGTKPQGQRRTMQTDLPAPAVLKYFKRDKYIQERIVAIQPPAMEAQSTPYRMCASIASPNRRNPMTIRTGNHYSTNSDSGEQEKES